MVKNLVFKAMVGSQAYGTSIPTSDQDFKGVYMQTAAELMGFGYKEQVEVGKDECYYEMRRFLQLLQTANPTVLELLYSPKDCIIQTSPAFDLIVQHRDKFLTKKCLNSFGGYAVAQIKKARGLDKKMNWERNRVERKTPMDMCYIYEKGKTVSLSKWLSREKLHQQYCGLVALEHFRDCYALYYDYSSHYGSQGNRTYEPLGYHGVVREDSNDIRLSSVPKGQEPVGIIFYNKDGYSKHCKDFNEYETWLANRNTQRYVDIAGHNQQIDGKNLLHCRRLLDMAVEIAKEGVIKVRRPNAEFLLKIRKGEVPLEDIIAGAEADLLTLNDVYENSSLPDSVDMDFVDKLLLEARVLNE